MEYSNIFELYKALAPVFSVKRRLLTITNYQSLKDEDIFKYLAKTKWQNAHDLTISEMVNDIITLDVSELAKERGN